MIALILNVIQNIFKLLNVPLNLHGALFNILIGF